MKEFNLNEYLKNPSQKVVTRDGRDVRIVCTDHKGSQPIIALVEINGKEDIRTFYPNGRWTNTNEWYLDLFFAPVKKEGWVNIYREEKIDKCGNIFGTKEEALYFKSNQDYITTVKIEWEE